MTSGARMRLSPDSASWTPHPPPQLDMAACLAYCWVGAVPHYSLGIEKDRDGKMRICAMHILQSPTHTSHIYLSFSYSLSLLHPHITKSASPAAVN